MASSVSASVAPTISQPSSPSASASSLVSTSTVSPPPRSLASAIQDRRRTFVSPTQQQQPSQKTPSHSSAPTPTPTTASDTNTSVSSAHANTQKQQALSVFGALDEFERNLGDLLNAVGQYKPATAAAKALVSADLSLGKAVEELMIYQENKDTIAQLTTISNSLDRKLDALFSALSEARSQLLSIPGVPDFSITQVIDNDSDGDGTAAHDDGDEKEDKEKDSTGDKGKKVNYSELLTYATRISKFTTAPVGLIKLASQPAQAAPVTTAAAAAAAAGSADASKEGAQTQEKIKQEPDSSSATATQPPQQATEQATTALADAIREAATAKQMGVQIWFPWPVEDQMRRSALFMGEPEESS